MKYSIKANSYAKDNAVIPIKETFIKFGTTAESVDTLANPAELFLSSFAACILKNVERFSELMKFQYIDAAIEVSATRLEKPPRMDEIEYRLVIHTHQPDINAELLKKNIEKFGTIFNTVQRSCVIKGTVRCVLP
ncbi:MAG: OsmC family protein [Flavobacteriaceae bacterium]